MTDWPVWKHELPALPHKLFNDAVNNVTEFYKANLEVDAKRGRLRPVNYWVINRGLLLSAMQTYAAVCILLAEKRPKPFLLQAGILDRSLFETLASVMFLAEDPVERTAIFEREAFKSHALRCKRYELRFGADPTWKDYLAVYRQGLARMGTMIPPSYARNPESIPDEWPTPGVMIFGRPNRGVQPSIGGSRREVLKVLYQEHYDYQSAMTHQRAAAVASAMLVEHPEVVWNPGHAESHFVVNALISLSAILAELQAAGSYPRHPKLVELWAYLRGMDMDAQELWGLRYETLVSLDD